MNIVGVYLETQVTTTLNICFDQRPRLNANAHTRVLFTAKEDSQEIFH